MVSLKQKSGFTIVELLIVIVIIGILAGLVITTFVGIQQRARNAERETDINSISSQLEGYFAKNGGYPSLNDLNNEGGVDWREGNEIKMGDADKAMADPTNGTPELVSAAAELTAVGQYSYVPTPTGCESPTDETGEPSGTATPCTGYTLQAFREGNAPVITKESAN